MRLLFHLVQAYPGRSLTAFGCLLFAALAEGIGLSSLLPLFSLAIGVDTPTGVEVESSWLQSRISALFAQFQLTPSIDLLCLVAVSGIALKASFVLLAHRQVGYTVAHVATDLRLALLRVLLAVRWEYYIRQPIGSLTNAYATEATRAAQAYLHGATIVALSIQTILYLSLLALTSWQATLGAVAVGTIVLSALSWIVRMARRAGTRQTSLLNSLLGQLTDILFAVKPLKAMAREEEIGRLLEHDTQRLNRALQREVLSGETLRALQDPLVIIGLLGGLYLALTRWHLPLETVIVLAILFERTLLMRNTRDFEQLRPLFDVEFSSNQ